MPKLRVIIKPPPEPQGDAEQQTEALRDYLLQMSEELAYVLTHLEADNINDSTFERIQSMIPRPYTGLPVMDGDASSGQSEQWARGDHRHGHDSSKADVTALEAEAAAREAHEDDTGNPHEVTKAQVGLGNVANERQYSAQNPPPIPTPGEVGAIPVTEKGSAGGVAELDSNGMVPSAQLPSYVDDVLEYASISVFPTAGESGKIYVALDTGRTYRWSGSAYVEISESLALGETSSTAYRGDRGKTAYDHSQVTSGNPHNVTAAEVGLGNVANERQYSAQNPPPLPTPADIGAATAQDLSDHVGDTTNPHSVTAAQVGVVPNPADPATDTLTKMQVGSTVYEITGGGGGGPEPATATPLMDGTGAVGSSLKYAREDHEHPADTNKQSTITASGILKGDGAGGVSAATAGTDYGTYSKPSGGIPSTDMTSAVQNSLVKADTAYQKPSSGIPSSDMASGVQTSLGKADTAYQKPSGGIPASDLANGVIPTVPPAYTSNPAMDGTPSPGSSTNYARGDHVHPTDTSRASASDVASLDERYTDNTIWRMNTDANDYKTSGLYAMATGNANVPAPWGILFVQGAISDTIEQEYRREGYIWHREFRNNTWSSWKDTAPTSELIGSGHTLIRCGKLRILKIGGFYAGSATITIPVADRTTFATSGLATYNDSNEAYMTFGLVIVNPDGSIAYKNWRGYNASESLSDVTNKWVSTPGVIWMTA